jgi:hypothetical protein
MEGKPTRKFFTFRIGDPEVRRMLAVLAAQDDRSGVNEISCLVRQEYARRHPKAQPSAVVETATA